MKYKFESTWHDWLRELPNGLISKKNNTKHFNFLFPGEFHDWRKLNWAILACVFSKHVVSSTPTRVLRRTENEYIKL